MNATTPAPQRPLLVFAHANGFPAGCYRKLFGLLEPEFEVRAPALLAHDPAHPVGDGWTALSRELEDFVRAQGRPALLLGHSLGGILSLLVASRAPQLATGVVLLDSPLVTGWRAGALWGLKRSGLVLRGAPVAPALRRRSEWPDLDAVRAHFASKPVFARWDPDMLADYAACGTRDAGGARVLSFRRETEAAIYATLPHDLGRLLRRRPKVPVAFVGGTESEELRRAGMAATRRLVGANLRWIEAGSHLFPFEQPQAAARAVLDLTRAMGVVGR